MDLLRVLELFLLRLEWIVYDALDVCKRGLGTGKGTQGEKGAGLNMGCNG